jgi:quercetin dioxygenase-like cupin family protein
MSSALAQDPLKVEPKHYQLRFENEHVQVVNIHYGPHEKSEMHEHPGGVVVVISGGHLKFTDQNGKVSDVYSKAGEARWFPPFKHKVENVGDEPYNAVYIAVKCKSSTAASPVPGAPVSADQLAQIFSEYAPAAPKP